MNSIFPNQTDDSLLLYKMSEGCQHAFKTLYEKYWESTYSSAVKRLKNTDLAKDIVQEIFTHIWHKREFTSIDNLPAYLQIAVRNRVLKHIAKQKTTHPFFDLLENIPSLYKQSDTDLLSKEFFKAYEALVNTLPLKKQRIFRMRFDEDLSTKEIALLLGITRKTVQNQLTTAVEYLRAALFLLLIILLNKL